jgi:Tfp pilus assembly protein PilX
MKEIGFVLVPALLFLFILSFIVFDTYEMVFMQNQLQQTAESQQQLFFLAEHGLRQGESRLQDFSERGLSVKVEQLSASVETAHQQFIDFRITSKASGRNQHVCLQSIYEVDKRVAKRKLWVVLDGDKQC